MYKWQLVTITGARRTELTALQRLLPSFTGTRYFYEIRRLSKDKLLFFKKTVFRIWRENLRKEKPWEKEVS